MAALTPRHLDRLAAPSRELIGALAERAWIDDAYLAGSAALTLYIGHRQVRDLDLMSAGLRLRPPQRRDLLADLLAFDSGVEVETARDGYLFVRGGGGTALKLFYYPYPLVAPEQEVGGLAVASAVDLGLMKLGAVISRGSRRDFEDLYLLCRELPLAELLERAPQKFGHVRDFSLQAAKALADHSAAERETPTSGLVEPLEWEQVQAWLERSVREMATYAAEQQR